MSPGEIIALSAIAGAALSTLMGYLYLNRETRLLEAAERAEQAGGAEPKPEQAISLRR